MPRRADLGAFRHLTLGRVGLHVMYQEFRPGAPAGGGPRLAGGVYR
ncbi:hypothetical protein ACLQ28_10390 [Micromonospora sp. DT201]